jgi:hypothetical protein
VGEILEGDMLTHIAYRRVSAQEQDHPTHVQLRTVRLVGDEWRVCLDNESQMHFSPMFALHTFEDPPEFDGESVG